MSRLEQTAFGFYNDDTTLGVDPRVSQQTPLERLLTMTGYPLRPMGVPSEDDWRKAELELNVVFPSCFKELLGLYGSGIWCDSLELFSPISDYPNSYHREAVSRHIQLYSSVDGIESFRLWPSEGGLLPLASTSSRLSLAWDTSNATAWSIVALYAGGPLQTFPFSITEFLYRCVSGKIGGPYRSWFTSEVKFRCGWHTSINPFDV